MREVSDSEQVAKEKRRAARELIAYFALTFAMTFGIGAVAIFFRPQFEAIFGPIGPAGRTWRFFIPFDIAASAPTISAVLWTVAFGGLDGLKKLFGALVRPVRLHWVFASFLTLPAGYLTWGLVERFVFGNAASSSVDVHAVLVSAPLVLFTTATIFIDPGNWGEETGWRGFALPRLLNLFSPLTASIVLGTLWSLWHLPAFLVSGLAQSHFTFAWFLVRDICLSIFMTWLYVNSNHNFLVAGFVPHVVNNIAFGSHAVAGIKVDALVVLLIAALVVIVSGPRLQGWRFTQTAAAQV